MAASARAFAKPAVCRTASPSAPAKAPFLDLVGRPWGANKPGAEAEDKERHWMKMMMGSQAVLVFSQTLT